jgi:hypothetical protein
MQASFDESTSSFHHGSSSRRARATIPCGRRLTAATEEPLIVLLSFVVVDKNNANGATACDYSVVGACDGSEPLVTNAF